MPGLLEMRPGRGGAVELFVGAEVSRGCWGLISVWIGRSGFLVGREGSGALSS